jgi:thiol-disulfide isomerase/thioredoxin
MRVNRPMGNGGPMKFRVLLLVVALFPIAADGQNPVVLSGTILDTRGNHVVGAEVARFWLGGVQDRGGFRAYGSSKSDSQGGFLLTLSEVRFPLTLLVMDVERSLGAVVTIGDGTTRELTVRLQSLHRVHYRFQAPGLKDLSQNRITLQPMSGEVFSQISGAQDGSILLPSGSYTFGIGGPTGRQSEVRFEVADHDVTLEPITLSASIAQYYGKPSPSLSDLEAINRSVFDIATLHNKWVLVYFWGYWCAPCVNEGLPKLARFYRENHGRLSSLRSLRSTKMELRGTSLPKS